MACKAQWPAYDEAKMVEEQREIAVQVNGKLRGTILVPNDAEDEAVVQAALAEEKISRSVEGKEIVRTIVVKNKLVNIVVK